MNLSHCIYGYIFNESEAGIQCSPSAAGTHTDYVAVKSFARRLKYSKNASFYNNIRLGKLCQYSCVAHIQLFYFSYISPSQS